MKPANILMSSLSAEATLYIGDFGESKLIESMGKTKLQTVAGTPSYMAPELLAPEHNAYGSCGKFQSLYFLSPKSCTFSLSLSVHCDLWVYTQSICGVSA